MNVLISELLTAARKYRDQGLISEAEKKFVEAITLLEEDSETYWELLADIEDECKTMLYRHRYQQ